MDFLSSVIRVTSVKYSDVFISLIISLKSGCECQDKVYFSGCIFRQYVIFPFIQKYSGRCLCLWAMMSLVVRRWENGLVAMISGSRQYAGHEALWPQKIFSPRPYGPGTILWLWSQTLWPWPQTEFVVSNPMAPQILWAQKNFCSQVLWPQNPKICLAFA